MESRTKNSTRNIFFATANYLLRMFLSFTVRTLFISYMDKEYLGLNGLFTNILAVLSIAELGVGSAIVYALYKPVAEGDIEKTKSLIHLYKKTYLVIALFITAMGLALVPFLNFFIQGTPNIDIDLRLVYVIFLFNTVISYFFAYRRAILFAHQRNDIENKISSIAVLFLYALQLIVLVLTSNYWLFIITMPIITLSESVTIYYLSYKMFPEIKGKAKPLDLDEKREISKNIGAMFCHKIGGVVVNATDSIIISAFLGLSALALYSNYLLITTSVIMFINLVFTACKSSIGNLIAKNDMPKTFSIFHSMNFLAFWLGGFALICIFILAQPFITLWIGKDFLIDIYSVLFLAITFLLNCIHFGVDIFLECAGLFRQHIYKPIAQSIINIVASIILVLIIGLPGVLLGTIISIITTCFWVEPKVLFKYLFKEYPLRGYFFKYAFYCSVIFLVGFITWLVAILVPQGGFWSFVAIAGICFVLPNLLFLLAYHRTSEFRNLLSIFKNIFKKK